MFTLPKLSLSSRHPLLCSFCRRFHEISRYTSCRSTHTASSWRWCDAASLRVNQSSIGTAKNHRTLFQRYYHLSNKLSSSHHHSVSVDVGKSPISISTGKYANLADGAVIIESGATSVMVTAVCDKTATVSPFLPLVVDYRERSSAANKIRMNFLRREFGVVGGHNDVLVSRFIDRSLRPLFPSGFGNKTQVICNMLQMDTKHDPEVLSINGASAALMISGIPWNGPIGAVRVGLVDGELCVNPNMKDLNSCELNLVVSCTKDRIDFCFLTNNTHKVMVEGSANEISEEILCDAVMLGFNSVQPLISSMLEFKQQHTNTSSTGQHEFFIPPPEVVYMVKNMCTDGVMDILADGSHTKATRDNKLFELLHKATDQVISMWPDVNQTMVSKLFWNQVCRECMRDTILDKKIRCDGRGITELRPINCDADVFKTIHGSAAFKRGETQVVCSVTFDAPSAGSRTDMLSVLLGAEKQKRFMVHYEFPPFATNTTGHFLSIGRREIGHGALAEKALVPLVPKEFPYTIRVSSQVVDSNGSSSMATVCGSSLALFDAGVPMQCAAAGVACGLVIRTEPDSDQIQDYQILTDINGIEDSVGNMDFKVAGTREGVTSLQVDVKGMPGLPYTIFKEALMQSRNGRYEVLDVMDQCMSAPREDVKENGPAFANIYIPALKRPKLLGVGGYNLRSIQDLTGVTAEMVSETELSVFSPTKQGMEDFKEIVDRIVNEVGPEFEVGSTVEVTVTEPREYGFIVKIEPGGDALLHISQISHEFVKSTSDLPIKVGDKFPVKYLGKDSQGRHKISRKALLPSPSPTGRFQSENGKKDITGVSGWQTISEDGKKSGPAIANIRIPSHKLYKLFGPGSYNLQSLQDATGVKAEMINGNMLSVVAQTKEDMAKFREIVDNIVGDGPEFEAGSIIEATVTEPREYGFMVELAPGVTCLLHKSQISREFVKSALDLPINVGDKISVKYLGKNSQGQHVISRKVLLSPASSPTGVVNRNRQQQVQRFEIGSRIPVTVLRRVYEDGFLVELAPGINAFLHKSNISQDSIENVSDWRINVGDKFTVMYLGKDIRGNHRISRKALTPVTSSLTDSVQSNTDNQDHKECITEDVPESGAKS